MTSVDAEDILQSTYLAGEFDSYDQPRFVRIAGELSREIDSAPLNYGRSKQIAEKVLKGGISREAFIAGYRLACFHFAALLRDDIHDAGDYKKLPSLDSFDDWKLDVLTY